VQIEVMKFCHSMTSNGQGSGRRHEIGAPGSSAMYCAITGPRSGVRRLQLERWNQAFQFTA
jgi:hypothetical protein